jgi:hypothetical protein
MSWIYLAQDKEQWSVLVNKVMTCEFHKILENSRVAERLVASQEELSSVELVSGVIICRLGHRVCYSSAGFQIENYPIILSL